MPTSPNSLILVAGLLLVLLAAWAAFVWWSRSTPGGEPFKAFMWIVLRVYTRFMHRPTYTGREHIPPTSTPGGLVVVSNHTGPIDPLVIQAACPFEIRWMMAAEMMVPSMDWLWRLARLIPVARNGRDTGPAREAIRHVRAGGVVGMFPEGAIVQPRCEVRPFHHGAGLIIARTHAPVLVAWVSGTPESPHMNEALATRSRSRVEFIDCIRFDKGADPATITRTLRERIAEASGWPINDQPLRPSRDEPERKTDPFAVI